MEFNMRGSENEYSSGSSNTANTANTGNTGYSANFDDDDLDFFDDAVNVVDAGNAEAEISTDDTENAGSNGVSGGTGGTEGTEGTVEAEAEAEAEAETEAAPVTAPVAAPAEEHVFDITKLRMDNFLSEIPDESKCVVYNSTKKVSELLALDSEPVLVFTKQCWDEVQHLVHYTPGKELALFLVMKQLIQLRPKYLAYDLYLPKQETGGAGVSIDMEDANKFFKDVKQHEWYKEHTHRFLAHLHSHASMGVFWSAADDNQQMSMDDFGYYDDFRFYAVVNTHNCIRASFVTYKPVMHRFDNIPVIVYDRDGVVLNDERKKEIESWLDTKTVPLTTNVFEDLKYFDTEASSNGSGVTTANTGTYVNTYGKTYADTYNNTTSFYKPAERYKSYYDHSRENNWDFRYDYDDYDDFYGYGRQEKKTGGKSYKKGAYGTKKKTYPLDLGFSKPEVKKQPYDDVYELVDGIFESTKTQGGREDIRVSEARDYMLNVLMYFYDYSNELETYYGDEVYKLVEYVASDLMDYWCESGETGNLNSVIARMCRSNDSKKASKDFSAFEKFVAGGLIIFGLLDDSILACGSSLDEDREIIGSALLEAMDWAEHTYRLRATVSQYCSLDIFDE